MNDVAIWLLAFCLVCTVGVLLEALMVQDEWDDDEPIGYVPTEQDWLDGGYPR